MKTNYFPAHSRARGYALLIVLVMVACMMIVMGGTVNRTYTVAKLNDRNLQLSLCQNAAEAAVEKVYARMAFDFQNYGAGGVTNNLSVYRNYIPSEDPYWSRFQFSNGQGTVDKTYVDFLFNYNGNLPGAYNTLFTLNSPVYRIVSNASLVNGRYSMTNAVQEDIVLALVPITTYAIFYNGLLEFSTCADMTVNGKVHANGNIYTGTDSILTFNDKVTCTGTLSAPRNNDQGGWTFPGGIFNVPETYACTNLPTVTLSISSTNAHSLIDIPTNSDVTTVQGQAELYNLAQVVLLVSNASVTVRIQSSPGLGQVPGADTSPTVYTFTNTPGWSTNTFPFFVLTNTFIDQRENSKTNLTTQIDLGKYAKWLSTNDGIINSSTGKFSVASATWPTILFVADNRTNSSHQLTVVRLTNGVVPPQNGGLGFTVATPNPLYVWGDYNQTNSVLLGTSNTSSGTVPAALLSDALTILSKNWQDSQSGGAYTSRNATETTVNAAIITGVMPSTSTNTSGFSGGVHNLPRLLENWTGDKLWLNTSIVNIFNSQRATNKFITPGAGSYYNPPTRRFNFDLNFMNPNKTPPGVPNALVPIRFNWAVPPPNTVTFNVAP